MNEETKNYIDRQIREHLHNGNISSQVIIQDLTGEFENLKFKIGSSLLGIYFGSGAPTISAPKGSLYLRTDGTTTNDRAYINTDAGTTWTALTTAA